MVSKTPLVAKISSLMQPQFVLRHTIRQTEISALLDSWVTNRPSVKMVCPKNIACSYIFLQIQHA